MPVKGQELNINIPCPHGGRHTHIRYMCCGTNGSMVKGRQCPGGGVQFQIQWSETPPWESVRHRLRSLELFFLLHKLTH